MTLNEKYLMILLFFPFISGLIVALARGQAVGWTSVVLSVAYLIISLLGWDLGELKASAAWFEPLGLKIGLSLDAYSYPLIVLSAFLTALCVFYSVGVVKKKEAAFHSLFHFLQGTVVATLLADDLIFFYVFWEAMLIPMYFIVGIWGGPRRLYATMKFFLYTFAGSLLMLVGLLALYINYYMQTGEWSASFEVLRQHFTAHPLPLSIQSWIFLSMVLSFAIKVPLFPFHTWLPDAHVEAPTAGSVILAGILLKMGTYGLMKFAIPLFPVAAAYWATPLCWLSVIGILLGAAIAWRQTDIKKLVAYSSVSHLGFVTLGIFMMNEISWSGAYLQMINHGISTGALFLLIGFIYDQHHTRDIEAYGGLAKIIPAYSVILMIMTLSSVALPGTNGFVGEFLILLGSFQVKWPLVVVAGLGVVLGAVYMLHLVQKLLFGKPSSDEVSHLKDLTWKEWVLYVPLVILVFVIGIFPGWLLGPIHEKTQAILGAMIR